MNLIYKIGLFLLFSLNLAAFSLPVMGQHGDPEKMHISNQERMITVYPMPVKNTAHIRLTPALREEVDKIEIINLIGRKLTEQILLDKSTTDVSFTNLNIYPEGIYMVVARDKFGKIVQSAKMIINK